MTDLRVAVTGAAGRLGRAVVAALAASGHDVVAIDRRAPTDSSLDADFVELDLLHLRKLDAALAGCAAVVHLAAYPSPRGRRAETVFRNNTGATFTVLEAAVRAGAETAIIASSTSLLGMTYAPRPFSPRYVPIDEEHPACAADPYALSKLVDEQTAAMIHRRSGMTVLAYRFHWIAFPDEVVAAAREVQLDPAPRAPELWGYVDIRDAAEACRLGLEASGLAGLGFAAMNITAADSLAPASTAALVRRFHSETTIRKELVGTGGAWSSGRARELIGYVPRFSWRNAA